MPTLSISKVRSLTIQTIHQEKQQNRIKSQNFEHGFTHRQGNIRFQEARATASKEHRGEHTCLFSEQLVVSPLAALLPHPPSFPSSPHLTSIYLAAFYINKKSCSMYVVQCYRFRDFTALCVYSILTMSVHCTYTHRQNRIRGLGASRVHYGLFVWWRIIVEAFLDTHLIFNIFQLGTLVEVHSSGSGLLLQNTSELDNNQASAHR